MVAPFNIDAFSTKTLRHFQQALEWSKKKFIFKKIQNFPKDSESALKSGKKIIL